MWLVYDFLFDLNVFDNYLSSKSLIVLAGVTEYDLVFWLTYSSSISKKLDL